MTHPLSARLLKSDLLGSYPATPWCTLSYLGSAVTIFMIVRLIRKFMGGCQIMSYALPSPPPRAWTGNSWHPSKLQSHYIYDTYRPRVNYLNRRHCIIHSLLTTRLTASASAAAAAVTEDQHGCNICTFWEDASRGAAFLEALCTY